MEPVLLVAFIAQLALVIAQDPYGNVTNALSVYEVTLPLPDYGSPCYSQVIVNQEFANSYGKPAYFEFSPPEECSDFTHVTADLYFASYDYQYDRLMHFLKDGIEVWRPSTPEPVGQNITSHESKDLSRFNNLFKTKGLIEFSLDNIIEGMNDGPFYTELRLNFYNDPNSVVDDTTWFYKDTSPPNDFYAIVANESLITQYPAQGTAPKLSRNTTRAVLNVYASGNSNEEFWYSNDLSEKGPTRLVQVFIDGKRAGVADPFPIVYTGGLNPGLWQPLMGLKASDVPSYIIDITPFLPLLWDHEAEIKIAVGNGFGGDQGILSDWIISASLLAWSETGVNGNGTILTNDGQEYGFPIKGQSNTALEVEGGFYNHTVSNSASLSFTNILNQTWEGNFSWIQTSVMENHLSESDSQLFVHQYGKGSSQAVWTPTNGSSPISYERDHYYPLAVSLIEQGSSTKLVSVNRSYDANITNRGQPYWETIRQESTDNQGQYTSITDAATEGYDRHAEALNGKVIEDSS